MPEPTLTSAEIRADVKLQRVTAHGMKTFSVGRPYRVRDPRESFQWRIPWRIGAIAGVDRARDERHAALVHAQRVADVITLATR